MGAKKYLRIAGFALLVAVAVPASSSFVQPGISQSAGSDNKENPREQQLLNRLKQIQGMKGSELSSSEKKVLRKEVKDIKKEMKAMKGGVYLSVGAIIIVVILLILLV